MDDLFVLIKSLTEADKKYLRQYAALQGGSTNYLKLFNYIDELESYSDENIKTAFKGEAFVKQLSVAKNYLNEVILRTFRLSAESETAETALQLLMLDIRFLMSKRCLSQVKKMLKRAQKLAEEQENFIILINIYALQRNLLTEFKFEARENISFDAIAEEEENTIKKLINVNAIYNIYCKSKVLITSTRRTLNDSKQLLEFDTLFNHPLMLDESTALSNRAKHWFWSALHFKHVYNTDITKDLECCLQHLALFEREPGFANTRPLSYLTVVNNLLEACRATNNLALAEQHVGLLHQIKTHNKREEDGQKVYIAHHTMWIALRKNDWHNAVAIAKDEALRLEEQLMLKKDSVIVQYTMITIVFITAREWSLASDMINKLLSIPKNGIREDILEHAKLMQLILQVETQQFDIAAGLHRNIRRSVSPYPLVNFLLDYYRDYLKQPSELKHIKTQYAELLQKNIIPPPEEFPEFTQMVASIINR